MFKLDLEKAEEPEIKLPTSVGSYKKQERGIGMGKTCEPKAFSFQCMTEFTTKKKKKSKRIPEKHLLLLH